MKNENEDDFWKIVKNNLISKNEGNRFFQTWFEPTDLLSIEAPPEKPQRIKLGVPSDLHKHWISENLLERLCSEISCLIQNPFDVELVVTGFQKPQESQSKNVENKIKDSEESAVSRKTINRASKKKVFPVSRLPRSDFLNPDYSFQSFIVGRNNEFAHASSYRIAQKPGSEGYNPLFIYGPTGMGKTHLLHAVGNHVQENLPHLKVYYVSAERFLNECVSGIRRGEMERFRVRYREKCDLLLIDDIQVIGNGQRVQEEFFHTLNNFFEKEKQVVVASDRMPKNINGLEDRIRTRLEWGLIADIQMPDFETRLAILRYKAEKKCISVPDEVANYIAKISKRSIRELEGNLNKVKMFSELQGLKLDLDLTKKVLAGHGEANTLTLEDIQKLTAQHFRLRVIDIKSKNRSKSILQARQLAMYLIRKYLNKSTVEIGQAFGGKDHSTVLNALRKMQNQLEKNSELKKHFESLEARIHNITGL